jgi:FKBP-type peptidyl-prolyl cis-trans isomerase SlpA
MSTTLTPQVQTGSFLTLHYRLSGPQGDIINTFDGQPATLTLGASELSPALENQLLGLPEGTHQTFELGAGQAFGQRNDDLIQWVSRRLLKEFADPDETYQVGEVVQFPAPGGQGAMAGTVRQVRDGEVMFDFNHPLADQPVVFEVKIIGIL